MKFQELFKFFLLLKSTSLIKTKTMNFKMLFLNLILIVYFVDGAKKDRVRDTREPMSYYSFKYFNNFKKSSIEKQLSKVDRIGDIKIKGLELRMIFLLSN